MKRQSPSRARSALAAVLFMLVGGLLPAISSDDANAFVSPLKGKAGLLDRAVLKPHVGDLDVRTDGAVIENLEIRGTLTIHAKNVVVRNVWVYTSSFWTVYVYGSATIEHSEIGHPGFVGERGIGGNNIVGRFLDIHHVEDGIKLGNNVLYESVHVHDLDSLSPSPHADAVQGDGGSSGSIIRDSILDSTGPLGFGNAAALIETDLGPISDVLVENSYLNGGNYTLFVLDGGFGSPSGVRFIGNTFGLTRQYGLISTDLMPVFQGNVLEDGRRLDANGRPYSGTFSDDDGSPHEADIEKLAAAGVSTGCGNGVFCPFKSVTRAEMAVLLVRALGESPVGGATSFGDVPQGAWYAGSIERLYQMGLVTGCAPDRFCPSDSMTRAEMAALLARATGLSVSQGSVLFVDVPAGSWFEDPVGAIYQAGITKGCAVSPLKYCPHGLVTRAQMATFLVRAFGL